MQIRFNQAARKHRVGRTSARHVLASVVPTRIVTDQGSPGWLYVGVDEGGRELEIVAVEVPDQAGHDAFLLVFHIMPTQLRRRGPHA